MEITSLVKAAWIPRSGRSLTASHLTGMLFNCCTKFKPGYSQSYGSTLTNVTASKSCKDLERLWRGLGVIRENTDSWLAGETLASIKPTSMTVVGKRPNPYHVFPVPLKSVSRLRQLQRENWSWLRVCLIWTVGLTDVQMAEGWPIKGKQGWLLSQFNPPL